jgi:hypothetical protein
MRRMGAILVAVVLMGWGGCGVPKEAGQLAGREEALLEQSGNEVQQDDAAVRATLVSQADAWGTMAALMRRRVAFGTAVRSDFVSLVDQAAALARRQRELIEQGKDEAAANRAALEEMRKMWGDVRRYLGE